MVPRTALAQETVQRLFGGRSIEGWPEPAVAAAHAVPESAGACAHVGDQSEFRCTQIVGFSQTMNWFGTPRSSYFESYASIDDERWQLLWRGGATGR